MATSDMTGFQRVLLMGIDGFERYVCEAMLKNREKFKRLGIYVDSTRPSSDAKKASLEKHEALGFELIHSDGLEDISGYSGFDCLIIMLGNAGLHLQPSIISAAIKAGIRHIYPSEYGADLLVGDNWSQRYYKYKTVTRDYLEEQGKIYPDLGWTYLTFGRLTEWSIIGHFGIDNANAKASIYGTASGRQSLIGAADAAEYLVATLSDTLPRTAGISQDAVGAQRRCYRISASSPTWNEIFEALNRITGRKYDVTYLPVESALQEEAEAKRNGDVEAELSASHKLVQGREGTLLPEPWDDDRFPWIRPDGFEQVLAKAFNDEVWLRVYGRGGNQAAILN